MRCFRTVSLIASTCVASCVAGCFYFVSPPPSPDLEVDHVYIVVPPGGEKEIAALRSAGLTIAPPSRHDGEGTTSVAAVFDNAYLELMWLDSTLSVTPDHAASVEQFRQAAAWRVSGHSPFGFGLRRLTNEKSKFAFPVKLEPAPWIDSTAAYEILNQPEDSLSNDWFVVPRAAAVPNWIDRLRKRSPQLLSHPGGGHTITQLELHAPTRQWPSTLSMSLPPHLGFGTAPEPFLEVYIGGSENKSRTDLRPTLPLVIIRN